MNIDVTNRVAVIVGGTGYLGSCIVEKLFQEGMRVVLLSREESPKKNSSVPVYYCDLSSRDSVEKAIASLVEEHDVPYLCVYTGSKKPLRKKITKTTREEMIDQFVSGTVSGCIVLSVCAQYMQEKREGVLIGITTAGVEIQEATQNLGAYIPAKYALEGVLAMLSCEMVPFGVRVHSIAPGFMQGGLNGDIPEAFVQMIRSKTGKIITREEVAEKVFELSAAPSSVRTILMAPEYE